MLYISTKLHQSSKTNHFQVRKSANLSLTLRLRNSLLLCDVYELVVKASPVKK